jgi:hypothetical protein
MSGWSEVGLPGGNVKDSEQLLWKNYVFREGQGVQELWDEVFTDRKVELLYITGRGFDRRANVVLDDFVSTCVAAAVQFSSAELIRVGFPDYRLNNALLMETEVNAADLGASFDRLGVVRHCEVYISRQNHEDLSEGDELSATESLRIGIEKIIRRISSHTDVILDISSLPRVAFVGILSGLLEHIVPRTGASDALYSSNINLYIVAGEDAQLDAKITTEDPSSDITLVPGFAGVLQVESSKDWPMVWFPLLGENRTSQLQRIMASYINDQTEVCPVLPHPSIDPRRADRLLVEYKQPLFDARSSPTSNIMYVHESHPFEAYRQLLRAMRRYEKSLRLLGGCIFVVSPLSSKLMTVGATLACFEMKPTTPTSKHGVAIPFADVTRYSADVSDIRNVRPRLSCLILSGDSYRP